MNVQVRRQNPTYPPDVTMSLGGKEMYVCIGGDVSEIPYMYAVAWRDGGFEGFRALTCTFTVPLVLAPCWICWITRPDLRQRCRQAFGWSDVSLVRGQLGLVADAGGEAIVLVGQGGGEDVGVDHFMRDGLSVFDSAGIGQPGVHHRQGELVVRPDVSAASPQ